MEDLADKKSISSQEFDEASARLKAAQAAYEMAVSRRAQVQSRIEQAVAGQRSARIMRDYTQIAAPFAGVVTARSVEPGTLASPGVPLLTIEREGSYRLEASVEESRLGTVHAGQNVERRDRRMPRSRARFGNRSGGGRGFAFVHREGGAELPVGALRHVRTGRIPRSARAR